MAGTAVAAAIRRSGPPPMLQRSSNRRLKDVFLSQLWSLVAEGTLKISNNRNVVDKDGLVTDFSAYSTDVFNTYVLNYMFFLL